MAKNSNTHTKKKGPDSLVWVFSCSDVLHACPCHVRRLTAQLHSDEVLEALVLQEHSGRSAGLEEEGDVGGELGLQRGEVQVRGLLVERGRVPDRLWKSEERRDERTAEELITLQVLQQDVNDS